MKSTDVYANEYTKADIEDVDIDEDGPPEHLWSNIAPSAEESRAQSMAEGVEQLTEVSQQDLRDNQHQVHQPCMSGLRVPLTAKKFLLTNINEQQRSIVMFHRDWCKKNCDSIERRQAC